MCKWLVWDENTVSFLCFVIAQTKRQIIQQNEDYFPSRAELFGRAFMLIAPMERCVFVCEEEIYYYWKVF